MSIAEIASFVAVILAAYATYRNSTRKSELDRLNDRVRDLEKRLADSDRRASDNEARAIEYREDVIKLGEQLDKERRDNMRHLAIVAKDGNQKINKVVFVLEQVLVDVEQATGTKPDVDIEALKRLVILDHVTGPLGSLDEEAVRNYRS